MNRLRIALGLIVLFFACTFAHSVELVDARGQHFSFKTPVTRVITLGPSVTELFFTAGAGDAVIATDNYSDFPQQVSALAHVGSVRGLDIEKIVTLQPELLVIWDSGFHSLHLETYFPQSSLFYVELRSFQDIATFLETVGALTGHTKTAYAARTKFIGELDVLRKNQSGKPMTPVFYQLWHQPLMTIGSHHVISDVMELCGLRNVFSDSTMLVPRVEPEAVLHRQPKIILIGEGDMHAPSIVRWQQWQKKFNFDIVKFKPELLARPTTRVLEGARHLCTQVDALQKNAQQNNKSSSRGGAGHSRE